VAAGKALDLMEAGPVRGYATSIRGTAKIDDIAGSDVVIIAPGSSASRASSGEDVYRDNAPIVSAIARDIRRLAPARW